LRFSATFIIFWAPSENPTHMLLQVPREPRTGEPQQPLEANENAFEAGMRRDLAAASIVSYEPVLGGGLKRAFDLTALFVTSPLWLPITLAALLWSKIISDAPMFSADRCVGYGGRSFKRLHLRLTKPRVAAETKEDEAPPSVDEAATRAAKWSRALQRIPQIFNVIRGDMSLVGPRALHQRDLDQLKSARRYYLSMRPGLFSISCLVTREHAESQYKAYALSWSLMLDLLVISDRLRGLGRGGIAKVAPALTRVVPSVELEQVQTVVVQRRVAP
jgi:exopolysaccharide production protein ExoY